MFLSWVLKLLNLQGKKRCRNKNLRSQIRIELGTSLTNYANPRKKRKDSFLDYSVFFKKVYNFKWNRRFFRISSLWLLNSPVTLPISLGDHEMNSLLGCQGQHASDFRFSYKARFSTVGSVGREIHFLGNARIVFFLHGKLCRCLTWTLPAVLSYYVPLI